MFHCLETLLRGFPAPQIWSVGMGSGHAGHILHCHIGVSWKWYSQQVDSAPYHRWLLVNVGWFQKCEGKHPLKIFFPKKNNMKPCIKIWPLHRSALRGIFVGISSMFYAARDRVDWVPEIREQCGAPNPLFNLRSFEKVKEKLSLWGVCSEDLILTRPTTSIAGPAPPSLFFWGRQEYAKVVFSKWKSQCFFFKMCVLLNGCRSPHDQLVNWPGWMNILPFADDPFIVTWKYSHRIPNYDTYLWSTQEYILHFYNRESRKKKKTPLFTAVTAARGRIQHWKPSASWGLPPRHFCFPYPCEDAGITARLIQKKAWMICPGRQSI